MSANIWCTILSLQASYPTTLGLIYPSFPVALWSNSGYDLLILAASTAHTTTHHSLYDSSRRVTSSSQRPLPDNTQQLQPKNIRRDSNPQYQQASDRRPTRQLRPAD